MVKYDHMFCMDYEEFQLVKAFLNTRKLEKSPFLNIISEKYKTPYWDIWPLAHVFKNPNLLKNTVYICDNNPDKCELCDDMKKQVSIDFLQEIRDVVLSARQKRDEYLFTKKRLEDRLSKQKDLVEELDKEYYNKIKEIGKRAEKTVLKLRCAPPETGTYYNYKARKYLHGSARPEITDEDRGIPQRINLNDWYRRKKESLEEEYRQAVTKGNALVEQQTFYITKDELLRRVARQVLLHNPQYNIDEELLKWREDYKPKDEDPTGIRKTYDALISYSGLTC